MTATALGLLAVAVLLGGPRPAPGRLRAVGSPGPAHRTTEPPRIAVLALLVPAAAAFGWTVTGTAGALVGGAAGAGLLLLARRLSRATGPRADDADLAAVWDLLATCLAAGLTVPDALDAAGRRLPGPAGGALRRVSGLLALGASAEDAWSAAAATSGLAGFARAAGRSASTGSALGRAASAEAARLRSGLTDRAEERAQRAAVRITAPLGLCFLPAFLVLGIVPVVVGLAGEAFAQW